MAFEERIVVDDHVCGGVRGEGKSRERPAFVLVLDALFDRVCGSAKDGTPYLGVDGHESGEEAYFAFWGL